MPSTRQFFLCFLVFNFNVFFSFRENFILGGIFQPGESSFFDAVPDFSPDLFSSKVRTVYRAAIGATKLIPSCLKPLAIITALEETCLVNQTTQTLDVKVITSETVGSVTGGVLGNDIYEVHHYDFYWQNSHCNKTHNMIAKVYFSNWKYGSFERAQQYPHGIVVLNIPISTNENIPNWKFDAFSKILGKKIKEPGDHLNVHSAFTYTWFVNFPLDTIYYSYSKQYIDLNSGNKFIACVIDLPLDPRLNFISNNQFINTFGNLKGISENSLVEAFDQDDNYITSKKQHIGVCVLNLPA